MFKKILIGVGVMLVALTALGASDCEVETDTPTNEAPPVVEAPAAEAPAAETEACYLTASCPLTNGWTPDEWLAYVTGFVIGLDQGNTPEAEALAGCMADVTMLRMTVPELLGQSDAESSSRVIDIASNECSSLSSLLEATLIGQQV